MAFSRMRVRERVSVGVGRGGGGGMVGGLGEEEVEEGLGEGEVGGTRSRERVCVIEDARRVVWVVITEGVEGDLERRARVDARQRLMEAMDTGRRGC